MIVLSSGQLPKAAQGLLTNEQRTRVSYCLPSLCSVDLSLTAVTTPRAILKKFCNKISNSFV